MVEVLKSPVRTFCGAPRSSWSPAAASWLRSRKSVAILAQAILAQVGVQAPGLSFRCICHLGNSIRTRFEVRFLFAVLIAWPLLLVALSSSVGNLVVLESCPLPVVENGYTAGRKPATCRTCGKTFPRPNVTLSDPSPAGGKGIKGNRSRNSSPAMSRRSRNVSPVVSRKASVVSWSDPPREQSEANGDDAVMEDGTETHQAEIIKKIRANDKLRKMLTNMPWEHRTFIYDDSFKSNMESLDDEKAALLAAKRQFLPLQSRIDKQKNYLERVSKEIESKQKKRLEILQKMDRG